jgi:hypothetical protein
METFEVAHLNIQNVNVIIIFVARAFELRTLREQSAIQGALQVAATSAGQAGNVVLVWLDEFHRMKFLAPPQQHPFFKDRELRAALQSDQLHADLQLRTRLGEAHGEQVFEL